MVTRIRATVDGEDLEFGITTDPDPLGEQTHWLYSDGSVHTNADMSTLCFRLRLIHRREEKDRSLSMIIKAPFEGEEQEFEVLPGSYGTATHVITSDGSIEPWGYGYISRLRLRILRKRHTSGGVVFEEVETRDYVDFGEWFMPTDLGHIQHYIDSKRRTSPGISGYIILRPVAIEDQP